MNKIYENEQNFTDKELCSKCGGQCCKASGCNYTTSDFSNLSYNALYELLSQGKICAVPFLMLRVRNVDRPIVDLISMRTQCSQWTENGCSYTYAERPTGAKNLVPGKNFDCQPYIDIKTLLQDWENYQKVLSRLVKRFSGMSVDQKLRYDIENFLLDFSNLNPEDLIQSGFHGMEDLFALIPYLHTLYPEEFMKANARYVENAKVKEKNKLNY